MRNGLKLLLETVTEQHPHLQEQMCVHTRVSPAVLRGLCFPSVLTPLRLLESLSPLLQGSLSCEGTDVMVISYLGLNLPRTLNLCTLSSCNSLYLFPSTTGGIFYDDVATYTGPVWVWDRWGPSAESGSGKESPFLTQKLLQWITDPKGQFIFSNGILLRMQTTLTARPRVQQ